MVNGVKSLIKPLSVNDAWQGKRFKTRQYKEYEERLGWLLPAHYPIPEGRLQLTIRAGFSNKQSDVDNVCKPFLDILQKRYNFNDRQVYKIEMEKEDVTKGEEYIQFSIQRYEPKSVLI